MQRYVNPFDVLGATPRDDRKKLASLADAAALFKGEKEAQEARTALLMPQSRLEAEIRWISPKKDETREALDALNRAAIEIPSALGQGENVQKLLKLCRLFSAADKETVLAILNADRQLSGFLLLTEEDVIPALKDYARQIARQVLEMFKGWNAAELTDVFLQLCHRAAKETQLFGCSLLEELVGGYELLVAPEKTACWERLMQFVQEAEGKKKRTWRDQQIRNVCADIRLCSRLMGPSRVLQASRGLRHEDSNHLVDRLDDAFVLLVNHHSCLEHASALAEALYENFGDLPRWEERLASHKERMENWQDKVRERKEKERQKAKKDAVKLVAVLLIGLLVRGCMGDDPADKPKTLQHQNGSSLSADALEMGMEMLKRQHRVRLASLEEQLMTLDQQLLRMAYSKGSETYEELQAKRDALQAEYDKAAQSLSVLENGGLPWSSAP